MGKGFLMCNEIHEWIENNISNGSTILELGSGKGTARMVKNYTVYSIEHSKKWMNRYGSNYIYAPIKDGWYDVEAIKKGIPEHYDLLLVDGPIWKNSKNIGRIHLVKYLDLFNVNCCMIFDDFHRNDVPELVSKVSEKVGRDYIGYRGKSGHRRVKFAIFDKVE